MAFCFRRLRQEDGHEFHASQGSETLSQKNQKEKRKEGKIYKYTLYLNSFFSTENISKHKNTNMVFLHH